MEREWTQQVEQSLAVLETGKAVDEVHRANVTARLSTIEDTLKWLVRLVLGGLILSGLTYALSGSFALT
ncbi:pseudouridine synthase [Cognatiyoonia sp.]|uniref:pseudouridine synthase n=1 Tax=Cognatiyoonia sp. TaxID=2211652 RepID=UPI003F69D747